MAQSGAYFEILDWLDRHESADPSAFLAKLQAAYETGPIIFLDADTRNGRLGPQRVHHSQRPNAPHLARALRSKPALDQILRVLSALEPIQLSPPTKTGNRHHLILGYPLPSLPGRKGCLLVETGLDLEALLQWRRLHDRDFLSLGTMLNARIATRGRNPSVAKPRTFPLTRRERETLAWIAAGKSYWETAIILGISERTIRHFMANAREKLDVVNNAQAVAEAVWRGLIPRLAEPQAP